MARASSDSRFGSSKMKLLVVAISWMKVKRILVKQIKGQPRTTEEKEGFEGTDPLGINHLRDEFFVDGARTAARETESRASARVRIPLSGHH